jgi:hypothetical protein
MASGGADAMVRLWNVTARRVFAVLRGHTEIVAPVPFAVDWPYEPNKSAIHFLN